MVDVVTSPASTSSKTAEQQPTPERKPKPWHGARGLAEVIGTGERRAAWLLERRPVPATKLQGRWTATDLQVLDHIEQQARREYEKAGLERAAKTARQHRGAAVSKTRGPPGGHRRAEGLGAQIRPRQRACRDEALH